MAYAGGDALSIGNVIKVKNKGNSMSMQHSYGFFTSLDDAMNDLGTTEINLLAAAMLARDADIQEKVEAIRQEVKILKEKLRQIREIK